VSRVAAIIKGTPAIAADTDLRFGQCSGTSVLPFQAQCDLRLAQRTTWPKIKSHIRHDEPA